MIFGLWSGGDKPGAARRKGATMTTAFLGVAGTLALALAAGCGGGGSGSNKDGGSTNNSSNATLTGTVVDPSLGTSTPDTGAVVAFGTHYVITGADGSFSLTIPANTAGTLIVYGKAILDANGNPVLDTNGLPTSDSTYNNTGLYPASSSTQVPLLSVGIPIGPQSGGTTDALGAIGLRTTNDPPLPPAI